MERHVTVELKAAQIPLAEAEFAECERSFTEIVLNATGKVMESKLTISEYRLEEKNEKIIGGVFLRSNDGVIVCDNSLDSRVRLVFEQLLPNIRNSLFPKRGPWWLHYLRQQGSLRFSVQEKGRFWCCEPEFRTFVAACRWEATSVEAANDGGSSVGAALPMEELHFVGPTGASNNGVRPEIAN